MIELKINTKKPLYVEIKQEIMNQCIGGHNCNFDYDDVLTNVSYISNDGNTYKLYTEVGECPSGWTIATWGRCEKVDYNVNAQYKINNFTFKDTERRIEINCGETGETLITVDHDIDDWYPEGDVRIGNLSKYATGRGTKRKIYIVSGLPNIGKSSLFAHRKDVLEIDTLPMGGVFINSYINKYSVFIYSTTRNRVYRPVVDAKKYDIVYVDMSIEE